MLKPQSVEQEQLREHNQTKHTHAHTDTQPKHNQTKPSVTKPNQTLRGNPSDDSVNDIVQHYEISAGLH